MAGIGARTTGSACKRNRNFAQKSRSWRGFEARSSERRTSPIKCQACQSARSAASRAQAAHDALVAADFHAPHIPEEYDGVGADALATCIVIEEVARVCASSSLIPAVNKLGSMPLLLAASEEVKARYLPPLARGEAMFSYGLSEREAGVVTMRFGLNDGQPRTLDEIGRVYGVTRERIRQIESNTMSKLRHPSRSKLLRDYLD